ncbi:MAG TPA: DUF971 domain-containing protein [Blastocatellia bacterium]|nr:DUF971 domain-containing protein [Blastocatellia bacterium]
MDDGRTPTHRGRRFPTSVDVKRAERVFQVTWDDGHVSRFKLADLRSLCDCATCRDEREERNKQADQPRGRMLPVLGVASRDQVNSVEHVGRYAFGVNWADGHNSIYSYAYLLESCPCDDCKSRQP